ncbi:hypothetical protein BDZ97DRAFT_854493 [Flammula alnicola]|nr:hypothetical protein BDZ97DRAFT_854493 [Flammula alnicola]
MSFFSSGFSSSSGVWFVSSSGRFASGSGSYMGRHYSPATVRAPPSRWELALLVVIRVIWNVMVSTIWTLCVLFVGNAVLKASNHGHLSYPDITLAATVGAAIVYGISGIGSEIYKCLPESATFPYNIQFSGTILLFVVRKGVEGSLCGVVGALVLLPNGNTNIQRMDMLYVTEAAFLGATIILGGPCVVVGFILLFIEPGRVFFNLGNLFRPSDYAVHITRRQKNSEAPSQAPTNAIPPSSQNIASASTAKPEDDVEVEQPPPYSAA